MNSLTKNGISLIVLLLTCVQGCATRNTSSESELARQVYRVLYKSEHGPPVIIEDFSSYPQWLGRDVSIAASYRNNVKSIDMLLRKYQGDQHGKVVLIVRKLRSEFNSMIDIINKEVARYKAAGSPPKYPEPSPSSPDVERMADSLSTVYELRDKLKAYF